MSRTKRTKIDSLKVQLEYAVAERRRWKASYNELHELVTKTQECGTRLVYVKKARRASDLWNQWAVQVERLTKELKELGQFVRV